MENIFLKSFIEDSITVHSNKYDYSKVEYKNTNTKVIIVCSHHGEFLQTLKNHKKGHGCPKCAQSYKSKLFSKTTNDFIRRSNQVHNNKYDYSKSIYLNNKSKIIIICKNHGEFKMCPSHHYKGHGCPSCTNNYRRTNEDFIKECKIIHNDKYSYNSKFKSTIDRISIECPIHGEFKQQAGHHLRGHGCPSCTASHGEKYITDFLVSNNIEYFKEKKFDDCLSQNGFKLKFDFYLPSQNLCIEYDGEQHFRPLEYFGGETEFINIQNNDRIKNLYCELNGIDLLRIKYTRPSLKSKSKINQILTKKIKIAMKKEHN